MSHALAIRLLGAPEILIGGAALEVTASRAVPLLALLACSGARVSRERAAALLWRRVEATSALGSLRQLLHHLPDPLREAIATERTSLALDRGRVQCDVWRLENALAKGTDVQEVLDAYPAPLLAGGAFDDFPEFDDWLRLKREEIAGRVRERIAAEVARSESAPALDIAARWLRLDPVDEDMHAKVMALHIAAGRTGAAETQYEELRRILATTAGRAPQPATRALLDAAVRRHSSPRGAGIPGVATSFVGRQDELAELARLASDPHCRLITLHGPGGVGKTRLAMAFAEEAASQGESVYFAGLEAAHTAQGFYAGLAAALELELSPRQNPKTALCEALKTHRGLLVLDNLEQLLPATTGETPEAALFLAELLRAAPHLKILATTRVAIGLQEEWLVTVAGLAYPEAGAAPNGSSTDAGVELFVSRARQAYRGFSGAAERPHILAICRAADGLPLALELAAAQVGSRPCSEIARDLLEDAGGAKALNRPDRQASVLRVIEQSLAAANAEQVKAFTSLALFQGAFTPGQAFAVARVGQGLLQELVARALLARTGERLRMHPLLRQVAVKRLQRQRTLAARIEQGYAVEIARLAAIEDERLLGRESAQAMASIPERLDDELAALKLATRHADAPSVRTLSEALMRTALSRGLIRACLDAWPDASDTSLPAEVRIAVMVRRADMLRQVGEYQEALELYDSVRALLPARGADAWRFAIECGTSGVHVFRGEYSAVVTRCEGLLALEAQGISLAERSRMLSYLGTALMELGELDRARELLDRATEEAVARGLSAFILVLLLNASASVAHSQGDVRASAAMHRRALELLEADGLKRMQAPHLCNLGAMLLELGGMQEAQSAFEQAIAIANTYGDRGPLAYSQVGLANTALSQGDCAKAEAVALGARANAKHLSSASLDAEATTILVRSALRQGHVDRARALLGEQRSVMGDADLGFRRLDVFLSSLLAAHAQRAPGIDAQLASALAAILRHPACAAVTRTEATRWAATLGHESLDTQRAIPDHALQALCESLL